MMSQKVEQLEQISTPQHAGPTAFELRHGVIHTQISRATAWLMIGCFAVVILAVPLMQGVGRLNVAGRVPTRGELKQFEDSLRENSRAAGFVQPRLQEMLCELGGAGSSSVVMGRGGWLFYRPGIDSVTGGGFLEPQVVRRRTRNWRDVAEREVVQPDPRLPILQFKAQVEAAGGRLVVLPIPDKVSLQGDRLTSREMTRPARNGSFTALVEELKRAGVEVIDVAPAKLKPGEECYLMHDTHWTPKWMDEVAHLVARRMDPDGKPSNDLHKRVTELSNVGDLAEMLRLREGQTLYSPQRVTIERVVDLTGERLRPNASSSVLLLGDSFSNIFSAGQMGWGDSAGLPEHLSYHLGQTIDWIARNDAGAHATREMLAEKLARGEDRLVGKRVVIWEFAERELSLGDWKLVEMVVTPPVVAKFLLPPVGEEWIITGTIAAKGASPRPERVAYRDHILGVHLKDVVLEGRPERGEALVYLRSMVDLKLTPAASLAVGQKVRVKVTDWSGVSRRYELINRSEVPDPELRRQPACWGELVER